MYLYLYMAKAQPNHSSSWAFWPNFSLKVSLEVPQHITKTVELWLYNAYKDVSAKLKVNVWVFTRHVWWKVGLKDCVLDARGWQCESCLVLRGRNRATSIIYQEALPHVLCTRSHLNFLIYKGNCVFFFYQSRLVKAALYCTPGLQTFLFSFCSIFPP
jgi:hypothetical protein